MINRIYATLLTTIILLITTNSITAQELEDTIPSAIAKIQSDLDLIKRLKISGYIQPQWQYIDSAGASSFSGGDFTNGSNKINNRFMMRRGRIKFTYSYGSTQFVLQPDFTEKGVFMRETYLKISDPWLNMFSITAGCLQVQFGYELNLSSNTRETPERARFNQILFPVERDLGVFGTIQIPNTSKLYGLKLDLGIMNGSAGVLKEFDSNKDFSGRLSYSKSTKNEKTSFAIGVSYYYGGYRQGRKIDYNFTDASSSFVAFSDTTNYEKKAARIYAGIDAQASFDLPTGITTIRAEYIQGEQPGTAKSSASIGTPPTEDIFHRNFNGAYFYLIQNLGKSKFQLVAKYDWYDPNVKIARTWIGTSGTNTQVADIRFDTYGIGLTYYMTSNVKWVAYYDWVINEETQIAKYTQDLKDNVFTLRIQYKF